MIGIQFYPTPQELAYKLISKLDFSRVQSVLEPSAGKGDFLKAFKSYTDNAVSYYCEGIHGDTVEEFLRDFNDAYDLDLKSIEEVNQFISHKEQMSISRVLTSKKYKNVNPSITCVEIDNNLCGILKQTYSRVINANFLDWMDFNAYDTILMNPPFADGDKHLLKAMKLLESGGGQICCILNAETIRNPYTRSRQALAEKLMEYHADIEYVTDAFADAERKADVDCALIYVQIPRKVASDDIIQNLVKGDVYEEEYKELSDTQLYAGDILSFLCDQFALEARRGLAVLRQFEELRPYLSIMNGESAPLIEITVNSAEHTGSMQNDFIRTLRAKYWYTLFQTSEISRLLTEQAREEYQAKMQTFKEYDFTMSNVKALQLELSQHLSQNIEQAIVNCYDNFTYNYSMDNEKNKDKYLFSGWKSNQGFRVNPKKVIVPMYGLYTTYGSWGSWDMWKARDYVVELEKIMTYLDGGGTEGESAADIINSFNKKEYSGEKVKFKYFDCEFKKKGTIHIYWKRDDLIKKLTIIGCKAHNTLPNDYGSRKYEELTEEEQAVVDNFEGKVRYAETTRNKAFYLGGSSIKLIQ